jgi:hypothetical protein
MLRQRLFLYFTDVLRKLAATTWGSSVAEMPDVWINGHGLINTIDYPSDFPCRNTTRWGSRREEKAFFEVVRSLLKRKTHKRCRFSNQHTCIWCTWHNLKYDLEQRAVDTPRGNLMDALSDDDF